MRKEYRPVHAKLLRLWNEIRKHRTKDDAERILMLQSQAMRDLIESMRVLVQEKHGSAAFILCRSVFEYSAVVDVLARSTDQQVLANYIDEGKLIVYEVGEAMGAAPSWLAKQRKEYEEIKARIGRKKWHGGTTIEQLVYKSQHGQVLLHGECGLYKTF
jgi:hypothetical protein